MSGVGEWRKGCKGFHISTLDCWVLAQSLHVGRHSGRGGGTEGIRRQRHRVQWNFIASGVEPFRSLQNVHRFAYLGNADEDALAVAEEGAIENVESAQRPSRSPSETSRRSRHSGQSSQSCHSIHVQVPQGVLPGEKFFVVVDNMEYEVWAPEGSTAGDMVAMDVYSDLESSQLALSNSREGKRSETKGSEKSVASDASLVYVEIPQGCATGETFFTEVNGFEYEILVPNGCNTGDLIYLEVPSKHTIGRFVAPESSTEGPQASPGLSSDSCGKENEIVAEVATSNGFLTEICVPSGVQAGQTFIALIDGQEYEIPVPAAWSQMQLLLSLFFPK